MSDEPYVVLTRAANPLQKDLIEQVLMGEGIPFDCLESGLGVIAGQGSPVGYEEFRVPPDRLQEAKDALCAGGIVCEVSHRLLRRTLEEVVEPLLETDDRDYDRLVHLVEINNKETVHALFEKTLELPGGRELLDDLFFELARRSSGALERLARSLAKAATPGFLQRFEEEATSGDKGVRVALIGVLPEFSSGKLRRGVLATALTDDEFEIRDAANEALFSLEGDSRGYDPEAPAEERAAAVKEILAKDFPARDA